MKKTSYAVKISQHVKERVQRDREALAIPLEEYLRGRNDQVKLLPSA